MLRPEPLDVKMIEDVLERIRKELSGRFKNNFKSLILYGSWAKRTPRTDSDIDLVALFARATKEARKSMYDIGRSVDTDRCITIIPASVEDFQKEKLPLYTAAKREGKILYGNADLSINPEPERTKYADFFKNSHRFESQKVTIAEQLLGENLTSGIAELCFVASKHAIQAALAMEGEGYSSKICVLLPLAEKYLGREIASRFSRLFRLYIKSEYEMEPLTDEEAELAIKYAKMVMGVYQLDIKKATSNTNSNTS